MDAKASNNAVSGTLTHDLRDSVLRYTREVTDSTGSLPGS